MLLSGAVWVTSVGADVRVRRALRLAVPNWFGLRWLGAWRQAVICGGLLAGG